MCENMRRLGQSDGLRQHIFAVRKDLMEPSTYQALLAASRVVFHARNGKIVDQITRAPALFASAHSSEQAETTRRVVPLQPLEPAFSAATVDDKGDLDFWNGYGGFASDGREYVVRLLGGQSTPQPWINVISNETFGFHV